MKYAYRPSGFGSYEMVEVKIHKLSNNLYQVEAGKKAVVISAKTKKEALKKACRYLGINCNEIISKSSSKV